MNPKVQDQVVTEVGKKRLSDASTSADLEVTLEQQKTANLEAFFAKALSLKEEIFAQSPATISLKEEVIEVEENKEAENKPAVSIFNLAEAWECAFVSHKLCMAPTKKAGAKDKEVWSFGEGWDKKRRNSHMPNQKLKFADKNRRNSAPSAVAPEQAMGKLTLSLGKGSRRGSVPVDCPMTNERRAELKDHENKVKAMRRASMPHLPESVLKPGEVSGYIKAMEKFRSEFAASAASSSAAVTFPKADAPAAKPKSQLKNPEAESEVAKKKVENGRTNWNQLKNSGHQEAPKELAKNSERANVLGDFKPKNKKAAKTNGDVSDFKPTRISLQPKSITSQRRASAPPVF